MDPNEMAPRDDRREVFGWMIYDWANSTFATTVVAALLGPYLTDLAQARVGDNGVIFGVPPFAVTAKSLYPLAMAASVVLQVLLLPLLGALADYSQLKKPLMAVTCYTGVVATCLLFFVDAPVYLYGGLLFVIANLGFGASMVFYNAFLPEITSDAERDKVSSRGYALGYLGGGILLALNFALVAGAARIGISTGLAVRLSLLSAGVWWGGFSLLTFARLRNRGAARALPPGRGLLATGIEQLGSSLRELARLPQTGRYLLSYVFFNDGIQTVVSMSGLLLAQELFVARGLKTDNAFLLGLVLMVQFVAFVGALVFERLARFGVKNAILLALAGFCGTVVYASVSLQTLTEAWVLAAAIALVLGGSQALSRSLFSRLIPAGREASFFGLYEISERGTSWIGPLIFGLVVGITGSYRQAMLSLIVLFVVGIALLVRTDVERGAREAHPALANSD
jgi:UMF1 family MFS transporter